MYSEVVTFRNANKHFSAATAHPKSIQFRWTEEKGCEQNKTTLYASVPKEAKNTAEIRLLLTLRATAVASTMNNKNN